MTPPPNHPSDKAEAFIARWQGHEGGQERANYALFLTELCDVLDLPHPDVARMYANRAADTDRWLRGMNKLQTRTETAV